MDIRELKTRVDLLALAGRDTKLKRVASSGGGEWAGPCPFGCGRDHDGFRVQPQAPGGGRWLCRGCSGGRWQSVIDYVMRREHIGFGRACDLLRGQVNLPLLAIRPDIGPARPVGPPAPEWQALALRAVQAYRDQLWAPMGRVARAWLRQRGLHDATLKHWQIGFNTGAIQWQALYVPPGIVLPCFVGGGQLWYVKVRRLSGTPKYMHVKGGRPALFGADSLVEQRAIVLVEGELDALLLWQEAGDLAGIATLGSAHQGLNRTLWGPLLLATSLVLVAYHADDAGRQGAMKLQASWPSAQALVIPRYGAADKDLIDFYIAGGDVRGWLLEELGSREARQG